MNRTSAILFFFLCIIFFLIFAWDVDNDRDFFTWLWLLASLYSFVLSGIFVCLYLFGTEKRSLPGHRNPPPPPTKEAYAALMASTILHKILTDINVTKKETEAEAVKKIKEKDYKSWQILMHKIEGMDISSAIIRKYLQKK